MNTQTLAPLPVTRIFVITNYGYQEEFLEIGKAVDYVLDRPRTAVDGKTPRRNFQILVEFENGDEERCCYSEPERTVAWLERFQN